MIKRLLLLTTFSLLSPLTQAFAAPDMNFTVTASEAVTVDTTGGTPRLALDIGGTTKYATYASGSGTSALTFTYTTQAGDLDLDGITVTSPLQMNGGTITDGAGNALSPLTFSVPTTTGVLVDHPSLAMDFVGNDYILDGTHYSSLPTFLTAAGGTFSRASVATYYDASGNLQTAAAGVPRFDHDPVTLSARGLLLEGSRTNHIPNSTFTGISSGGPYTTVQILPGWTLTTSSIGSATVTKGSANGIDYLQIRLQVTNGTAGALFPALNSSPTLVSVTNGDRTILSGWFGVTAYSSTGGTCTVGMSNRSNTAGGAYISEAPLLFTAVAPYQYRQTAALTHGATAGWSWVNSYVAVPPGVTCDITYRIGGWQFEKENFVTSYIPTSSVAVTRAADSLRIPTGSWFSATQGGIYAQGIAARGSRLAGDQSIATFDATAANGSFLRMGRSAGKLSRIQHSVLSTTVSNFIDSGWPDLTSGKISTAYAVNNFGGSYNGRTPQTSSSGSLPTVNRLIFTGFANDTSSDWNGHLQNFRYYPARVPDTQLRLLTQ